MFQHHQTNVSTPPAAENVYVRMCVIGTKKPLAKCQARLQQQQQLLVPMSNANANAAGVSRFDLIAKDTGCLLLLLPPLRAGANRWERMERLPNGLDCLVSRLSTKCQTNPIFQSLRSADNRTACVHTAGQAVPPTVCVCVCVPIRNLVRVSNLTELFCVNVNVERNESSRRRECGKLPTKVLV